MATPDEGDKLDPRVKVELERLNSATHEINTLEFQLDEARSSFRHALTESTQSLNATAKRLGACIEKARPFYDARQRAKELHQSTQQAAVSFERANSMLAAAKEMVDLAEMGLLDEGREFDANWQEMLNHATMKVGEAELEKNISERQHERTAAEFDQEELVVKRLQKSLKSVINKSSMSIRRNLLQLTTIVNQHDLVLLPYFEAKSNFNQQMEEKKQKVRTLEIKVARSKEIYSQALHNLEEISSEIHEKRKTQSVKLGKRVAGVGAEAVPEVHVEKCRTPPSHLKFGPQTTPSKRLASPRDEMVTRDDMFLGIPSKMQTPKRPLSLQEAILPPDPHNILGERGSLENLDNISDNDSVCSDQSQEHDTTPVSDVVQNKSTISHRTHRRVSSEASNVMFGLGSNATRLRIANSSSSGEPLQIVHEISNLNISSENAFIEDDAEKLSSICEIKSIKQLPNSQSTEVISDVCVSDNSESQSTINGEHLDSPSTDSSRVPKVSSCIGGEDGIESSTGAHQDGAFNSSTETTIF